MVILYGKSKMVIIIMCVVIILQLLNWSLNLKCVGLIQSS